MRREAIFGAGLLVAIGLMGGAGCSPGSDCDFGLCAEYIIPDGGGPDVPSNCDLSLSPSSEPTCVVDAVGVFVSPNGHAGAAATMADPVASIGEAVQKAVTLQLPRVYVCAGTYMESVTMMNAISLYGGFDCSSWMYTKAASTVTSAKGPALSVRSVKGLITIDDLGFSAFSNGNVKGDSAIAVLLLESNVTFERATITAGAGQPGAQGGTTMNAKPGGSGAASMGSSGGSATTCMCPDNTTSTGGRGSDAGGANAGDGSSNPPPSTMNPNGGKSGNSCDLGTAGLDGAPGNPASAFAVQPGIVTASGWDISNTGTTGENGRPGQGGGGSGAQPTFAGGGGGCGGCGGGTGLNGKNGGASIGIVAYSSQLVVTDSTITTGAGGVGGQGGGGEMGAVGGTGGQGGSSCVQGQGIGATGGSGAGGNGGNGGAGGDSIAIAYGGSGSPPTVRGGMLKPGNVGMGGDGGPPGGMASATQGIAGIQGAVGVMGRSLAQFPQ